MPMDDIARELDTMIDLVTLVDDEGLMKDLAVTLQRLQTAYTQYVAVMYKTLTEVAVAN
jgi:hypothetical protein